MIPQKCIGKVANTVDLSNWIKNNGGGWKRKDAAQILEKKFVTDLASVLWYVDSRFVKTLDQK
jgi:hypothetical protein